MPDRNSTFKHESCALAAIVCALIVAGGCGLKDALNPPEESNSGGGNPPLRSPAGYLNTPDPSSVQAPRTTVGADFGSGAEDVVDRYNTKGTGR